MSEVRCKECIGLLVDYLEGELPGDREKQLDEHFIGCPPCLDFLDQYRASTQLGKKAIVEEMPRALADKLSEFLRKETK